MNELGASIRTINSKEVAEMVGKNHKDLLADIRKYTKYLLSGDFRPVNFFVESTYKDSTGRTLPCYEITKQGCEMVANKLTGEKGVQFTAMYVERFNQMEQSQIPSGKQLLALAMIEAQKTIEEKDEQIKKMEPKALFADAVSTSETSILIGDLAKLIKQNGVDIGQRRLFEWLRANRYLIRQRGVSWNMPTQRAMDMKLFEIKETTITHSSGQITVNRTVKVTGKGQQYFINKFITISLQTKKIQKNLHYI